MSSLPKELDEAWIETYTGKHIHFNNPSPDEIDIEDIAHALSMECRFGGHLTRFYSVAEHSMLVASSVDRSLSLEGLLHDASEAYLRDIASPVKHYLSNYKDMENVLMKVIAEKFNFNWPISPEVKEADLMALKAEARQLLPGGGKSWVDQPHYATKRELDVKLHGMPPHIAKEYFMGAFLELTGQDKKIVVPVPEILIAR